MYTFEGKQYEDLDFAAVGMPEWREVKKKLGMTIADVEQGFTRLDPDALTVFWWLTMRQHDPKLELDPAAEFDSHGFLNAWASDKKPAADPTLAGTHPAGATPASNGSAPATSTRSSTTTGSSSPAIAVSATGSGTGSPSADLSRM